MGKEFDLGNIDTHDRCIGNTDWGASKNVKREDGCIWEPGSFCGVGFQVRSRRGRRHTIISWRQRSNTTVSTTATRRSAMLSRWSGSQVFIPAAVNFLFADGSIRFLGQ